MAACGCCFSFVEFIGVKKKEKKKTEGKKRKGLSQDSNPAPSDPRDITLQLHHKFYEFFANSLIHAAQMFLYNDFPLILKLLVQIASIFSAKYFCRRNASPKARPQFQPDQDSGLPVQVYGLADLPTYSQRHDVLATLPKGRQWPQKQTIMLFIFVGP